MNPEIPKIPEGGNTVTPSYSANYNGNKFILTHNNYQEEDIPKILSFFKNRCTKYILAKEIGKQGTPHLQGAFITKQKMKYRAIFNLFGFNCSLMNMKGTFEDNIHYCSKDNNVIICSEKIKKDIPGNNIESLTNLYPWQQSIINLIETKPNNRNIHWIYDKQGNKGKSSLCIHILQEYNDVLLFSKGKSNDISYQIINTNIIPKLCLFDISRTINGSISYSILEEIKNGCINTSKYEGGFKLFGSPHVIIFSNQLPDFHKLSLDRWKVYYINDTFELINYNIIEELIPNNIL